MTGWLFGSVDSAPWQVLSVAGSQPWRWQLRMTKSLSLYVINNVSQRRLHWHIMRVGSLKLFS